MKSSYFYTKNVFHIFGSNIYFFQCTWRADPAKRGVGCNCINLIDNIISLECFVLTQLYICPI